MPIALRSILTPVTLAGLRSHSTRWTGTISAVALPLPSRKRPWLPSMLSPARRLASPEPVRLPVPSRDEQRQDHLDKAVWHLKQWARSEARDELAGEIDEVVQMHDAVIGALHE